MRFLDVLEKIGCHVEYHIDGISVTGRSKLNGLEINMREYSDTFMTLAAVACFLDSDTKIFGLGHTKWQESNRISSMSKGLIDLGIYVETTSDSILISPSRSKLRSAEVDSYNDHRIAMSLSLLGLKKDNVVIKNAEAVNKTCKDYFSKMKSLVC